MVVVKFNSVDEFIDELRLEGASLKGAVLRLTNSWRKGQLFTVWSVIASAVSDSGRCILHLDRRIGEYMGDGPDRQEIADRAEAVSVALREVAAELGMTVRAGVFEAA